MYLLHNGNYPKRRIWSSLESTLELNKYAYWIPGSDRALGSNFN